jgi:excisionase family DNA binding protein
VVEESIGMVLSVKDMAALLGCSEQAVYNQVYRQALPYRKLGRKVIYLRQEVEAYLQGLPGLELRHISL